MFAQLHARARLRGAAFAQSCALVLAVHTMLQTLRDKVCLLEGAKFLLQVVQLPEAPAAPATSADDGAEAEKADGDNDGDAGGWRRRHRKAEAAARVSGSASAGAAAYGDDGFTVDDSEVQGSSLRQQHKRRRLAGSDQAAAEAAAQGDAWNAAHLAPGTTHVLVAGKLHQRLADQQAQHMQQDGGESSRPRAAAPDRSAGAGHGAGSQGLLPTHPLHAAQDDADGASDAAASPGSTAGCGRQQSRPGSTPVPAAAGDDVVLQADEAALPAARAHASAAADHAHAEQLADDDMEAAVPADEGLTPPGSPAASTHAQQRHAAAACSCDDSSVAHDDLGVVQPLTLRSECELAVASCGGEVVQDAPKKAAAAAGGGSSTQLQALVLPVWRSWQRCEGLLEADAASGTARIQSRTGPFKQVGGHAWRACRSDSPCRAWHVMRLDVCALLSATAPPVCTRSAGGPWRRASAAT